MIKFKEGSILDAPERIICHQVNCQGKMGRGIALEIRNKYPIVYDKYIELYNKYKLQPYKLLGSYQLVKVNNDRWVANIFGQNYYGLDKRYTDYNALVSGLSALFIRTNEDIAIPYKMGCRNGGADWDKLMQILEILASDFKHDVIIYKLPKR